MVLVLMATTLQFASKPATAPTTTRAGHDCSSGPPRCDTHTQVCPLLTKKRWNCPLPGNSVPLALSTGAVRAAEQPAHGAPLFVARE